MDRFLVTGRKRVHGEVAVADANEGAAGLQAKRKARRYDDEYLKMGFTWTGTSEAPRPQCVVCADVLAQDSMRPCKLRRHLETKHPSLVSKPLEFFLRKLQELRGQKKLVERHGTVPSKAVEASYCVALRIAKAGKPHSIGEQLLLPAAKEMCAIMLGDKAAAQLDVIPLSNDTVCRRIEELSVDVKKQILDSVRQSPYFALQIDESTDIAHAAQLLVYVRYAMETEVSEEFLFCQPLPARATGEELFHMLNKFITEEDLAWSQCVGICSDGARAMTGRHSGMVTRLQAVAPSAVWNHCMIHREALAAKRMPADLHKVLADAVKVVNFIKARPVNARLFAVLCEEMGANHKQLLLHTEVRWLSRGKVLTRLFELRDEVRIFLADCGSALVENFHDSRWLALLAYLADVFDRLNTLNASLQGRDTNMFIVRDRIEAFCQKLQLWSSRLQQGLVSSFPTLEDFLQENELSIDSVQMPISEHLSGLHEKLCEYFPEYQQEECNQWVRNPFIFKPRSVDNLPLREQESLIDMATDPALKVSFGQLPLAKFWLSLGCEFPELKQRALKVLLPFASTYLCESGFSALAAIKTKYRSRLRVEDDLRLYLSTVQPRIQQLTAKKQAHRLPSAE